MHGLLKLAFQSELASQSVPIYSPPQQQQSVFGVSRGRHANGQNGRLGLTVTEPDGGKRLGNTRIHTHMLPTTNSSLAQPNSGVWLANPAKALATYIPNLWYRYSQSNDQRVSD